MRIGISGLGCATREVLVDTVVLAFDAVDMDLSRMATELGDGDFSGGKVLSVRLSGGLLHIVAVIPLEEGLFDGWPHDLIPADPKVFSVDYREVEAVGSLVRMLAPKYNFVIDTNFDRIYTKDDFLKADSSSARPWWDCGEELPE